MTAKTGHEKFSVLCSVYNKESPEYLDEALESVHGQSLQADEVVIVEDGPLTSELYLVLKKWGALLPIKNVKIGSNVGLGRALNKGLDSCEHDLVIRIDTDDINSFYRFEKQIRFLSEKPSISVLSGHVEEFDDTNSFTGLKKVPAGEDLFEFSLTRNPINHMACAFRKSAVINSGGYKHFLFMEDYYLWLRMLSAGYHLDNIQEVLVRARTGLDMIKRRKGFEYFKSELRLCLMIYKLGLTKKPTVFFVFVTRALSRLLPVPFLNFLYKFYLR